MIQLTFTDKDRPTKTTIHNSDSAQFLAFNVTYKNDGQPFVYILDTEKKIKRLNNKSNIVGDYTVDLVLNLS